MSTAEQVLDRESAKVTTRWTCEKWGEDAVRFCQRKMEAMGIDVIPAESRPVELVPNLTKRERVASIILGRPVVEAKVIYVPRLMPVKAGIPSILLRELVGEPEECVEIKSNLLVNEGIQRLMDMTMIATLTGTGWNNANAFLGVGDSATAEAATQTELQAATNRFYKAMNATFPSRSSQTSSFQSDFTTSEANYVWNEWSISSGATTASGAGFTTGTTNLNRKVASLGTKASGTWTLTGQLTIS